MDKSSPSDSHPLIKAARADLARLKPRRGFASVYAYVENFHYPAAATASHFDQELEVSSRQTHTQQRQTIRQRRQIKAVEFISNVDHFDLFSHRFFKKSIHRFSSFLIGSPLWSRSRPTTPQREMFSLDRFSPWISKASSLTYSLPLEKSLLL